MKILRLTTDGLLEPLTAQPIEKNDTIYYNIFHGSKTCWEFRCAVDSRIATPKINKDLILKEDHFIFRYLKDKDDKEILDQVGNKYIVISKNSDPSHKLDTLLFWDIEHPVTNIEFTINGFANEIGRGYNGTETIKSPAPVLEIYGDCELSYTGQINDKNVAITYLYDYNNSTLKRI